MMQKRIRIAVATVASAVATVATLGFATQASAETVSPANSGITVPAGFSATVFAKGGAKLSSPNDITELDGKVFVAYQNGVGTKGQPSKTGQKASTVVEYNKHGKVMAHWDLMGRVDGMAADAHTHQLIATVNAAGNSSIYTIRVTGNHGTVKHYNYSSLTHGGGTSHVTVTTAPSTSLVPTPPSTRTGPTRASPPCTR